MVRMDWKYEAMEEQITAGGDCKNCMASGRF